MEHVVSVDTDHNGLCMLNEDNTFRIDLINFCHTTLRTTHDKLSSISSTCKWNSSKFPFADYSLQLTVTFIRNHSTIKYEMRGLTWVILSRVMKLSALTSFRRHNLTQATRQTFNASPSQRRPGVSMPVGLQLPCYLLDKSVAVTGFIGRKEVLREIDDHLLVKDGQERMSELKTVAISSMGGIGRFFEINIVPELTPPGKTSIAYQFAKTRRQKFHAVFWVNADTAGKLNSSFVKMALELKLQRADEDRDQVMSRNLVLKWLENPVMTSRHPENMSPPPEARWLLVFDNVDNFELMKRFWPLKGAGSILITSRRPHASGLTRYTSTDHDSFTHRIELKALGKEEAQESLYRLTKKEYTHDNEHAARNLARRLQGYPLFLEQFASYMMNDSWKPENNDDNNEHTTATLWMLNKLKSESRMVMNVVSFFHPDHIEQDIMTEGIPSIKVTDYPKSYSDYCKARDALCIRSLISTDMNGKSKTHVGDPASRNLRVIDVISGKPDGLDMKGLDSSLEPHEDLNQQAKSQLRVHRVIQDLVRSQMNKEQQRDAFGIAVSLLITRWGRKEGVRHYDHGYSPRVEHLYPHVLQIRCHYEALEPKVQETLATLELVGLMNCAGW